MLLPPDRARLGQRRLPVDVFGSGFVELAKRVAPSLPLYAGAAALLAQRPRHLVVAERDAAL
jgi:hypothetical protein